MARWKTHRSDLAMVRWSRQRWRATAAGRGARQLRRCETLQAGSTRAQKQGGTMCVVNQDVLCQPRWKRSMGREERQWAEREEEIEQRWLRLKSTRSMFLGTPVAGWHCHYEQLHATHRNSGAGGRRLIGEGGMQAGCRCSTVAS